MFVAPTPIAWAGNAAPSGSGGSAQCERQSKGRTLELLFETSAGGDAEGADELLEVNLAAIIRIEDVEDVVRELSGVAEREELLVYPTELFLVQMA
jgi:hypothetical protein